MPGAGHAVRPFCLRTGIGKTEFGFLKKEIAKATKFWLHVIREYNNGRT
jgi:hypothetical protein